MSEEPGSLRDATRIYISVEGPAGHLVVDGPLELLREVLAMRAPEGPEPPAVSPAGCCATCGWWQHKLLDGGPRRAWADQQGLTTWHPCALLSAYQEVPGRRARPRIRGMMFTAPDFGCQGWQARLT